MTEPSTPSRARSSVPLTLVYAASILLLALLAGCASTGTAARTDVPRKVTGCRFEPVHYEEVYRCSPNPGTGSRLVCSHRDERIPDRWWLEYEGGDPREVDEATCNAEGEAKRWECHDGQGYVFLDERPASCT